MMTTPVVHVKAKVQGGTLVLEKPVELAGGTEVSVTVVPVPPPARPMTPEEIEKWNSEFAGIWAHRDDMKDSVAWVRKEREQWRQPLYRRD